MIDQPYQLLPPLSAEEFTGLRADIEANGIRVPVDVDEDGQVLDGHHRQRIAAELGIPCPTRVLAGLTEDEKRAHAVAVNTHRRALTVSQRRDLVHAELERDPSRSDRAIGRLCGVDGKTVAAIRVRNSAPEEAVGQMDYAEARRATDELRTILAKGDEDIAALVAGGHSLDAVRILTEAMDTTMAAIPDDPEFHSGVRLIFEPRIRAVLLQESLITGDPAAARLADLGSALPRGSDA
jgi:ParB-like chromosome segregation protein Spo0J